MDSDIIPVRSIQSSFKYAMGKKFLTTGPSEFSFITSVALPSRNHVSTCSMLIQSLTYTMINVGETFQPKSLNPIWARQFPFGHLPNMMFNMVLCDFYVLLWRCLFQLFFIHFNLASSFIM